MGKVWCACHLLDGGDLVQQVALHLKVVLQARVHRRLVLLVLHVLRSIHNLPV